MCKFHWWEEVILGVLAGVLGGYIVVRHAEGQLKRMAEGHP